ncbi:MAG: hypothetical protein QGH45_10570 [Myxococcota bacterium]|jgi:hypothetical protein|nr:hypothetical protein [Myxococcota bacterium]
MRRLFANPLITLALAGATFLGIRAATGADADNGGSAAIDCEAWYDRYTELTGQIPPFAAARERASEAQLGEARTRYVAACEKVTGDPATYGEDLEVLICSHNAEDAAGWMACVDPVPPKPTGSHSEAANLLLAIRTAELAYHAEWDVFHPCGPTPAEIPGGVPAPFQGGGIGQFHNLGWVPDGDVLCRYSVTVSDNGMEFEATAECDEDGDGEIAVWKASRGVRPECSTAEEVR